MAWKAEESQTIACGQPSNATGDPRESGGGSRMILLIYILFILAVVLLALCRKGGF